MLGQFDEDWEARHTAGIAIAYPLIYRPILPDLCLQGNLVAFDAEVERVMLPNFKRSETEPVKSPTAEATPPGSPTSAPIPPRPAGSPPLRTLSERSAPSVIGPDLIITGNLTSKGEMQIDGEVQGDIRATNLIIGERARITGTIVAEEAVIRGQVLGSIRSKRVMLQSSSHVEGDVFHQSLAIEQGAYFEGKSRRSEDPMAGVAPAASFTSQQSSRQTAPSAAPEPPAVLTPSQG